MRYIYFFPPFNFSESDHSFLKKLEGFLPHAQHLLPPTDRGEEEDLTACSDCSLRVQQRFHELSITGRPKNVNFRRLTVPESVL